MRSSFIVAAVRWYLSSVVFLPASALGYADVGDWAVAVSAQGLAVATLAAPASVSPVLGRASAVVKYYDPFEDFGLVESWSFGWLDGLSKSLP